MIEFGKSLRNAREAKGYTVAQLAEVTRLAPSLVTDLENEEFGQIAAPIYGRGFVRLYCEAVGLEAKVFIDEFMEIFNGNREPQIKERPRADSPVAAETLPSELAPQTADERPAPVPMPPQDLFQTPTVEPSPVAVPEPRLDAPEPKPFDAPADDRPLLSRYSSNFRTIPTVSPTVWRMGALVLVTLALLTAVFLGLRALRRATLPTNGLDVSASSTAEPAPAPANATAEAKAPRTPLSVAPLYID